jgi:hypothetical protein
MRTSTFGIALAGLLAASASVLAAEAPSWVNDYRTARERVSQEQKPLAVIVAPGANWEKVAKDGQFSDEVGQRLRRDFVCLYVDSTTPDGRKLADALELPKGVGVVVSDRTGELQAFRHAGELSSGDLSKALTRAADPELVVRSTATVESQAPKPAVRSQSYYAPVAPGAFCPTCNGGSCPTCGGGYRR